MIVDGADGIDERWRFPYSCTWVVTAATKLDDDELSNLLFAPTSGELLYVVFYSYPVLQLWSLWHMYHWVKAPFIYHCGIISHCLRGGRNPSIFEF